MTPDLNTTQRKNAKRRAGPTSEEIASLRHQIIASLKAQGFSLHQDTIAPPKELSKAKIRQLHLMAVEHRRARSKDGLFRIEAELLDRVASGHEVDPQTIQPRLVEVRPESFEELLFRYAGLHWSIPISSGYGRRLRFIVIDESNDKLMGLIGLGDPVYRLGSRDRWISWSAEDRSKRLKNVMDAFVLGAVPPYSSLLCGKLVALLAAGETVRRVFKRKYGGQSSIISKSTHDGRLALITTTSALGRSSVYNRLRLWDRPVYENVGFTRGSGEFHFSNGLYSAISNFAVAYCDPTAKQDHWGTGFRNRREIVKKVLLILGFSGDWLYHGIEREVFVVPLARNTKEFLRGENSRLYWYNNSDQDIFNYFRERWMLPRSGWDSRFSTWSKEEWTLWKH